MAAAVASDLGLACDHKTESALSTVSSVGSVLVAWEDTAVVSTAEGLITHRVRHATLQDDALLGLRLRGDHIIMHKACIQIAGVGTVDYRYEQ